MSDETPVTPAEAAPPEQEVADAGSDTLEAQPAAPLEPTISEPRAVTAHEIARVGPYAIAYREYRRDALVGDTDVYAVKYLNALGESATHNVHMQSGPVGESGLNGLSVEVLIGIARDRLEQFQSGAFPCPENGQALTHLAEALHVLERRTSDRLARGVEGRNVA